VQTTSANAAGRVNLVGEHTDYNDGFVLPAAIAQTTRVRLTPRSDDLVAASSSAYAADGPLVYRCGEEQPGRGWLDYVQGVSWSLREAGHLLGGFEVEIDSDVPVGSGLASSAALEVALLRALRTAFALPLDDLALARLGQRAENGFVGAQTGIMDQLAASFAQPGQALFIDCRTLVRQALTLPAQAGFAIVDSGIHHDHAAGGYNQRRAECAAACRLLEVASLRDLTTADLDRIAALPAPLDRRARHVVSENRRVLDAVDALASGDLVRLGALLTASHRSQRDDYEVSLPAIDRLVAVALAQPGVFGARLTGGGWGGCVLLLASRDAAARAAERTAAAGNAAGWWLL
jgi:galactokinase